jgi:hypothetical protein
MKRNFVRFHYILFSFPKYHYFSLPQDSSAIIFIQCYSSTFKLYFLILKYCNLLHCTPMLYSNKQQVNDPVTQEVQIREMSKQWRI